MPNQLLLGFGSVIGLWKIVHSLLDGLPESDPIAARRFEIIARRCG